MPSVYLFNRSENGSWSRSRSMSVLAHGLAADLDWAGTTNIVRGLICLISTIVPHYTADSDIRQLVVDPDFLLPGGTAKWACLS